LKFFFIIFFNELELFVLILKLNFKNKNIILIHFQTKKHFKKTIATTISSIIWECGISYFLKFFFTRKCIKIIFFLFFKNYFRYQYIKSIVIKTQLGLIGFQLEMWLRVCLFLCLEKKIQIFFYKLIFLMILDRFDISILKLNFKHKKIYIF
jgi:hypothetical protein